MGDIVNLRMVRKARRRTVAEAAAQENSAAYGRSKTDRDATKQEAAKAARHLDGHKRDNVP